MSVIIIITNTAGNGRGKQKMSNVFEEMEKESNNIEVPQKNPQETVTKKETKKELTPEDVGSDVSYINNPEVGQSIEFTVEKVEDNEQVTGKAKDGTIFGIGCRRKDGTYLRRDITTVDNEQYTINSWEIFYKLFGKDAKFMELSRKLNTFKGIKVKITRNYNGGFATEKVLNIAKLMDFRNADGTPDLVKAEAYKAEVVKAKDEKRLYTVEVFE